MRWDFPCLNHLPCRIGHVDSIWQCNDHYASRIGYVVRSDPTAPLVWGTYRVYWFVLALPDAVSLSNIILAILSGAVTLCLGYGLWYS